MLTDEIQGNADRLYALGTQLGKGGWNKARAHIRVKADNDLTPPFAIHDGSIALYVTGSYRVMLGEEIVATTDRLVMPKPPGRRGPRPSPGGTRKSVASLCLNRFEEQDAKAAAKKLGVTLGEFAREAVMLRAAGVIE